MDEIVGFPSGNLDVNSFLAFFSSAFGLSAEGAVALIGAHTIGAMHREGSGYSGSWKVDLPGDRVSSVK